MRRLLIALVKELLPKRVISSLQDFFLARNTKKKGITIRKSRFFYDIMDNPIRIVRISRRHRVYIHDIINSFDYYFSAVVPLEIDGVLLVDYSTPRIHEVVGYDLHPIMFSSFAEPTVTTRQYLEFAKLEKDSIVLDLGAYSGLTSIIFDQTACGNGRVIAIDADKSNIKCIKKNFELYKKITGRNIELLEGAVWKDNEGISFSTEGNMGSSAVEYVGSLRGKTAKVKTFTLSTIVKIFALQKLDFIKCDVEGAESVIFNDHEFFNLYKPRIFVEPHYVSGKSTVDACIDQLSKYGYSIKRIEVGGDALPFLECYPNKELLP